jgi:hypothetical protein
MKRILPFMIIIICSTSIYGQKKKSVVRNRLKSMLVYEQKYDKTAGKATKDSETKFDSHGNIIEEIEYEGDKISTHVKYEYDEDDNLIKETELNTAGKATEVIEYKYDSDGRKIKETELNSSGKINKIIDYKYDGDLKTEKVVYDGTNKIKSKKTYQYQTY